VESTQSAVVNIPPLKQGKSLSGTFTIEFVSKLFPQTPIDNIKASLPSVLKALEEVNLGDSEMVLLALSTIRVDNPSFLPTSEGISRFNTSPGGHPFDLYDNRVDLGNQGPPDGAVYKGRGYAQITGRSYYAKVSQALGLGDELLNNPDRENSPDIAARTLAWWLKQKEQSLRAAVGAGDLESARRVFTGGLHGLNDFRDTFNQGLKALAS
jgi:peptidoglycan L-alanyl-D-glutamate endopeptidase CwlK